MKFKFKKTTKGLEYSGDNYLRIVLKIFSLILLSLLIYFIMIHKVQMYDIIGMLIIIIFIHCYGLLQLIILHFLIYRIESLKTMQEKRQFLLTLTKFYHRSNLFIYFVNRHEINFIKFRRWLYDMIKDYKFKVKITDCFMFFFYYPFTRLILLFLNISLKLSASSLDELISARIQGYVLFGLFILPFILNTFAYHINILHIFLFYYFLLIFIAPLVNWLSNMYNGFIEKSITNSFEQNLLKAVYARKNQLMLNFSNLYPTVAYVYEQRKAIHVVSIVLGCYKGNVINSKILKFKKYNINETWPTWHSWISPQFGIYKSHIEVFQYCYLKSSYIKSYADFYYLENTRYISYYWYNDLYHAILYHWQDYYIHKSLYDRALAVNDNLDDDFIQHWQNCLTRLYYILEMQFKLIWDIEKDWGLNPLDLHPELCKDLQQKGRDYPIYEDAWDMLLGDPYGLLKINLESYKVLISNYEKQKSFDSVLETKIIDFYVDNYVDYRYICKFFSIYGKYIIEDFKLVNSNKLMQEASKDSNVQLQLKNKKYLIFKDEFWNIYNVHPPIRVQVGVDIAKWREEWRSVNRKKWD